MDTAEFDEALLVLCAERFLGNETLARECRARQRIMYPLFTKGQMEEAYELARRDIDWWLAWTLLSVRKTQTYEVYDVNRCIYPGCS